MAVKACAVAGSLMTAPSAGWPLATDTALPMVITPESSAPRLMPSNISLSSKQDRRSYAFASRDQRSKASSKSLRALIVHRAEGEGKGRALAGSKYQCPSSPSPASTGVRARWPGRSQRKFAERREGRSAGDCRVRHINDIADCRRLRAGQKRAWREGLLAVRTDGREPGEGRAAGEARRRLP